eukprot:NODE_296_length_11478_cov_0.345197.p10 type:complete len:123 gc:universal NODE_296_length_11478_cov_0.345197:943-1311(+)
MQSIRVFYNEFMGSTNKLIRMIVSNQSTDSRHTIANLKIFIVQRNCFSANRNTIIHRLYNFKHLLLFYFGIWKPQLQQASDRERELLREEVKRNCRMKALLTQLPNKFRYSMCYRLFSWSRC